MGANQRMTGAQAVVHTLDRLEVERVFQITGLGVLPLSEAFYERPGNRTYVTAVSETNLSLIANGYARATGRPAFLNVYHSSGTALAMMGLTTAWSDQVPLVLTSIVSSSTTAGRDQYAAVPRAITEATQQFTKWSAEIPRADRIPEFVERAFQIASTPPYGPVHLGIPMDFLEEEIDFSPGAATDYLHAAVDPDAVELLATILESAVNAVLVAGTEVARYEATPALERVVDLVDASVLSEIKGADLSFPNTNPRFVGKLTAASPALEGADVVVLLGVELTEGLAMPMPGFGDSRVVQVTVDPLALRRQHAGHVGILSHPRRLLEALEARLIDRGAVAAEPSARVRELRRGWEAGRVALRQRLIEHAGDGVSAAHIADAIHGLSGQDIVVVNQCGSAEGFIDTLIDYGAPSTYFGLSGKASAQGWGAPASVGIQMALPGRRVIAVLGDGGFMFNSTAIHAAAGYDAPVIYLVLDNGGWRDVATVTGAMGSSLGEPGAEDAMHWTFQPPIDYALFAHSLGLKSWRATNPEQLEAALAAASAQPGPSLIHVSSALGDVKVFGQAFA